MTVDVRPATDADAPALADLLNAIIARGGTTSLEAPFTPERLARSYLTGPKVISCFAAFDGARNHKRLPDDFAPDFENFRRRDADFTRLLLRPLLFDK